MTSSRMPRISSTIIWRCRPRTTPQAGPIWKAIDEVYPGTRHQRCWVHKTANVLNKVALSVQVNMKADLREIYGASTRAAAEAAIGVFADKYRAKYEKAVACLGMRCRLSPTTDVPSHMSGAAMGHQETHALQQKLFDHLVGAGEKR